MHEDFTFCDLTINFLSYYHSHKIYYSHFWVISLVPVCVWDITCFLILWKGVCVHVNCTSYKIQLCIGQVICRLIYQFNESCLGVLWIHMGVYKYYLIWVSSDPTSPFFYLEKRRVVGHVGSENTQTKSIIGIWNIWTLLLYGIF